MNASTPERTLALSALRGVTYALECLRSDRKKVSRPDTARDTLKTAHEELQKLVRMLDEPVRVEEPAGERVAQSANADVRAEILAQTFHEAYELLAPSFGYKTREESAVPWEYVPRVNKDLMIAVAATVLTRGGAALPGTLPVPVGDETEALRARLAFIEGEYRVRRRQLLEERERAEQAEARVAGLEARDARLRRAAGRVIARHDRGCGVIHGNKPKGYTCIDRRDEAREHPDRFMPEYAVRVGSGEELCDVCTLRAALADSGEAGS